MRAKDKCELALLTSKLYVLTVKCSLILTVIKLHLRYFMVIAL